MMILVDKVLVSAVQILRRQCCLDISDAEDIIMVSHWGKAGDSLSVSVLAKQG